MNQSDSKSITVIGAGSVGVSTAIHLQQHGWQVTLIDRLDPGRETSFGNAGVINGSSIVPLNNPGIHKSLASYLRNNTPQLRYNVGHVIRQLPWVLQFLQASKTRAATQTSKDLHSLCEHALDEHKALMQRTGNMHRLTELGWLKVFRHGTALDPSAFDTGIFERLDVKAERMNADELRELEPALKPIFNSAYLLPGSGFVNNPGALISEYAQRFVADGGEIRHSNITSIVMNGSAFECQTESGQWHCERLVIAAGPWSADLLANFGYRVPLGFERGYHAHFHLPDGVALSRSVYDVNGGYVMGPMERGLRLTTGVELNHRDAPSNHSQLEQATANMKQAIDAGERTDDPVWRGCRPTLPDSKPVIGPAPHHKHLWAAFGHQHIGLMTGPITGKLMAQLISNEATDIDLAPFAPERYLQRGRTRPPIWRLTKNE